MCFGVLTRDEATEKPLRVLLRAETEVALRQGILTALAVLAVVLVAGPSFPPTLAAGATVAAFLGGVLVHQVVLLVGVTTVRALTRGRADRVSASESV